MTNTDQINLKECREDCKEHTGLSFEQILRLTGIFGVHPDFDYNRYTNTCSILYDKEDRRIFVSIKTEIIVSLKLKIDLKKGEISIDLLEKGNANTRNVALNLIASMVASANECEIDLMYLYAMFENSDGFIVWGLVGFIPIETDVNNLIEELILEFNQNLKNTDIPKINSFYELLVNPESRKLWERSGIGWTGEFSLQEPSESIKILNQEIQRKQHLSRKREEVAF